MDLQEFVGKTLLQILAGVAKAQKDVPENGGRVRQNRANSPEEFVKFDIAIVATDTTEKSGGLRVAGLMEAGAGETSEEGSTNRVQFVVPIQLP